MSSFVVEKGTIDLIVWALKHAAEITFNRNDDIGDRDEDLDRVGSELWHLNEKATASRYQLPVPKKPSYVYGGSLIFRQSTQLYKLRAHKAMSCFLYQCAEGDEFENDAYYKLVKRAQSTLAASIIEDLPEYDSIPWK